MDLNNLNNLLKFNLRSLERKPYDGLNLIQVFNFQCSTSEQKVDLEDSSTYYEYLQVEVATSPPATTENAAGNLEIKTEENTLKEEEVIEDFVPKDHWAEDDTEPLAVIKENETKLKANKTEIKLECCDSEETSDNKNVSNSEVLKIPNIKSEPTTNVAKIKIPKPPKVTKAQGPKTPKKSKVLKPQFIDCEVCGKSVQRQKFKLHMMVHNGEKPHLCDTCGKSFTWKFALVAHKRVHSGEKPYLCKHCGQRFRSSSRFAEHSTIHTGRRSYVCERCALAFRTSGRLKRHLRIHTGEKPYVCSYCERGFSESYNLKQHRRLHTGEKPPHVCYICTQAFIRKKMLVDHLRIGHGIVQPSAEVLALGHQQQQEQMLQSQQRLEPCQVLPQSQDGGNALSGRVISDGHSVPQSSIININLPFDDKGFHKHFLKDTTEYK